jgi:hypothetical protein
MRSNGPPAQKHFALANGLGVPRPEKPGRSVKARADQPDQPVIEALRVERPRRRHQQQDQKGGLNQNMASVIRHPCSFVLVSSYGIRTTTSGTRVQHGILGR